MGFRFTKRIRIVPGVYWERREESSAHLHFLPFHALSASCGFPALAALLPVVQKPLAKLRELLSHHTSA